MAKKIVRLTESDLIRLVKRIIKEDNDMGGNWSQVVTYLKKNGLMWGQMKFGDAKGLEGLSLIHI